MRRGVGGWASCGACLLFRKIPSPGYGLPAEGECEMHGLEIFIGAAVVLVTLVRKPVYMRKHAFCFSPAAREDLDHPCCGLVLPDRFEAVRQSGGRPAP